MQPFVVDPEVMGDLVDHRDGGVGQALQPVGRVGAAAGGDDAPRGHAGEVEVVAHDEAGGLVGGATGGGLKVLACSGGAGWAVAWGMCWVWASSLDADPSAPEDDPDAPEDDPDDPDEDDPAEFGIWMAGRLSRSWGMSGGATGGCPLIISGPLALLTRVAQPP